MSNVLSHDATRVHCTCPKCSDGWIRVPIPSSSSPSPSVSGGSEKLDPKGKVPSDPKTSVHCGSQGTKTDSEQQALSTDGSQRDSDPGSGDVKTPATVIPANANTKFRFDVATRLAAVLKAEPEVDPTDPISIKRREALLKMFSSISYQRKHTYTDSGYQTFTNGTAEVGQILNGTALGDASNQRLGNSIKVHSVHIRGYFYAYQVGTPVNRSPSANPPHFRFLCSVDHIPASIPGVSQTYGSGNPPGATPEPMSNLSQPVLADPTCKYCAVWNPVSAANTKILYSEIFPRQNEGSNLSSAIQPYAAGTIMSTPGYLVHIDKVIKLDFVSSFLNGGTNPAINQLSWTFAPYALATDQFALHYRVTTDVTFDDWQDG